MNEVIEILAIDNYLFNPTGSYSSGMLKKLSLLSAFMGRPAWILLDEPFSHLDDANRKLAMALIEEEAELRKAGIILADLKTTDHFNSTKTLNL